MNGIPGMTPPYIQAGPCASCGAENYPLSMGGPGICPACDCMPPEKRVRQLAYENRRLRALLAGSIPNPDMHVPFADED